jgi:hypothetical protein
VYQPSLPGLSSATWACAGALRSRVILWVQNVGGTQTTVFTHDGQSSTPVLSSILNTNVLILLRRTVSPSFEGIIHGYSKLEALSRSWPAVC